jgi:hypothetical protein
MEGVEDDANEPFARSEREAWWGCTTCETTWKFEGASVESEGSGVDDGANEPFIRSGRDAMWGHETSEVAA